MGRSGFRTRNQSTLINSKSEELIRAFKTFQGDKPKPHLALVARIEEKLNQFRHGFEIWSSRKIVQLNFFCFDLFVRVVNLGVTEIFLKILSVSCLSGHVAHGSTRNSRTVIGETRLFHIFCRTDDGRLFP